MTEHITAAATAAPARTLCMSTRCADIGKAAEVSGIFDCSHINGRPPRPASYCMRCAVGLAEAACFTPTDGTELPSLTAWLRDKPPADDPEES